MVQRLLLLATLIAAFWPWYTRFVRPHVERLLEDWQINQRKERLRIQREERDRNRAANPDEE